MAGGQYTALSPALNIRKAPGKCVGACSLPGVETFLHTPRWLSKKEETWVLSESL